MRLRYVEYEFLMGTGEGHVGDKRIRTRGLQLGIAAAEVEKQPFQSQRGNNFPRIGDEIARWHQVLRHGQRRVLKPADRFQGKLREIRAFCEAYTRGRLTRDFPS